MIKFKSLIEKFDEKGEKTGWTFITVPFDIAEQIKPGKKTSYRVKGRIDEYDFTQTALIPMGEGNFIIPLKAEVRTKIRKRKGDTVVVELEADDSPFNFDEDLMTCLDDEPKALAFFKSLPPSHQKYFSKWIENAKTDTTKSKRIAQTINTMLQKQTYAEMIRAAKQEK